MRTREEGLSAASRPETALPLRAEDAAAGSAARQSRLRSLNLATVLAGVYAAAEPPSRADVAAATGLTRSTVSRLVDELIAYGLVAELEPVIAGQRGRPAVPLVPASGSWLGLGLEVNISHLAARLVDLAGNVAGQRYVARDRAASASEDLAAVAGLGRELLASAPVGARLAGVEVALPGLVDAEGGVLLRAPNLGWRDVPAADLVAEALGVPRASVGIGNESDFAALTVARIAPGRPSELSDFLYIFGEVGSGSALVRHGRLVSGRHGWAGEIGHVCVDPDGAVCGCGARGCLETVAGQRALNAAAGVTDADALAAALASGDPRARAAMDAAARALGVAVAGALNLLDVSLVVLGGHLGERVDALLPLLQPELTSRVLSAPFDPPTVATVSLDAAPPALGAAYAALERVIRDPAAWLDALMG